MKKRFFIILALVISLVSIVTFSLSYFAAKQSIEKLILERANTRLSMIMQGFNFIANDIDIYSFINFSQESISIKKGALSVFQYGTSTLDQNSPKVKKIEEKKGGYVFTLYIDLDAEVLTYIAPFRWVIAVTALMFSLIFMVAGILFINTVVEPITSLAFSMAKITSHNLRERIPLPKRKDEISQLVITFNSLIDEIEGAYNRLKTFVDDMTHDIVTPVQILEGYRQLIERHGKNEKIINEFLDVSKIQLFRLKEMTSSLKAAFLIEKRRRVEFANASEITSRNVIYYQDLYPSINFVAIIENDIRLPIESMDLERVENILLDNAVKHGDEGGRIEIILKSNELAIRDFGKGIAEPALAFDGCRKNEDTKDNVDCAGIGLSILKRFSEEYGFTLDLESQPGKGCQFILKFPIKK